MSQQFCLLLAAPNRVPEAGTQQRHRQLVDTGAPQHMSPPLIGEMCAEARRRRIHRASGDVGDRARHRDAANLCPNRHRVRRDAVDEIHRAVDGVEHPSDPVGGCSRHVGGTTTFLPENRVTGPKLSQPITQEPLRVGVDHGHRIGRAALRAHRAVAVARPGDAENLGPTTANEGRRLGSKVFGHRAQPRGFVVRSCHRPIASQSPPAWWRGLQRP
ncbi:Uncharacterised protein [Mycobacterium tuberculosis]|nr:Uncharacterised protein [Mycobacterium tuberculosis]CFE51115.1 Uncharacterised protein [Mycobacterium tuberculosis]CKR43015.1 Uncharacterised protein [Mycobacterium tuberculosis]CKR51791.1 Uncharacterised protein [Mycobacterium tuberculosis]CKS02141.1 Uncharacterised protein [Mycobacterium tuberculosis]